MIGFRSADVSAFPPSSRQLRHLLTDPNPVPAADAEAVHKTWRDVREALSMLHRGNVSRGSRGRRGGSRTTGSDAGELNPASMSHDATKTRVADDSERPDDRDKDYLSAQLQLYPARPAAAPHSYQRYELDRRERLST